MNKETTINTANQGVIEITYSLALVRLTKIVEIKNDTNRFNPLLSPRILYFARTQTVQKMTTTSSESQKIAVQNQ